MAAPARTRPRPRSTASHELAAAEVVEVIDERRVQVRRLGETAIVSPARLAVPGYVPTAQDHVVVAFQGDAADFVIGVLKAAAAPRIEAPGGASASLRGGQLVLSDPSGAAVISYDVATGGVRVAAPGGDLTLAAPAGRVVIQAATEIELTADRRAHIAAPQVDLTASEATLHTGKATLIADALATTATEAAHTVGRWELRAQQIFETAVDAYREFDGLAQTRAGRVRTLVSGAYQLFAGRAAIIAKGDTVVDGKRVLLG